MIELILGGARSGKSACAQQLAFKAGGEHVVYVATATPVDAAMAKRIKRHQQDRPPQWQLIECPMDLAQYLQNQSLKNQSLQTESSAPIILVDCLTLWLNNQLYHQPEQGFDRLFEQLEEAAKTSKHVIFVANEVGQGIIPLGELSRQFVDEAGRLNQRMAQVADRVIWVVAGLPQVLKGAPL